MIKYNNFTFEKVTEIMLASLKNTFEQDTKSAIEGSENFEKLFMESIKEAMNNLSDEDKELLINQFNVFPPELIEKLSSDVSSINPLEVNEMASLRLPGVTEAEVRLHLDLQSILYPKIEK